MASALTSTSPVGRPRSTTSISMSVDLSDLVSAAESTSKPSGGADARLLSRWPTPQLAGSRLIVRPIGDHNQARAASIRRSDAYPLQPSDLVRRTPTPPYRYYSQGRCAWVPCDSRFRRPAPSYSVHHPRHPGCAGCVESAECPPALRYPLCEAAWSARLFEASRGRRNQHRPD